MALRRTRHILVVGLILLIAAPLSCVKVRGPGIMPPVKDEEARWGWKVLRMGGHRVPPSEGQDVWRWRIRVRFTPEEPEAGLLPLDLAAAIDGAPVPFTFEPDDQLFTLETSPFTGPGEHLFELTPSRQSTRSFPALTVHFESP